MARGRPKKIKEGEETQEEVNAIVDGECGGCEQSQPSEKERLLDLRKQLADLRVNSVSDLDGLISRAE